MPVILGLINWFIEVISSSPWLPRKTLCLTTGNWFLHSHAIIPEANGDISKIALSRPHLALPTQPGMTEEVYHHEGGRSNCSQTHDCPHGSLSLKWTELLGWDVAKAMRCSLWSFLIHESCLLFRTYLKWQKSPTTVHAGRASPLMATMGPSHEDSAWLPHLFMVWGPCCLASVMWCWWHWWPASPGRDMVTWLDALAQEPAQVPNPSWGFCLLGGGFCILGMQRQQGWGWLAGLRSGRFLSHTAGLNAVVWVFPLSNLDSRGAGWEHFNYKDCSINRLQCSQWLGKCLTKMAEGRKAVSWHANRAWCCIFCSWPNFL